MSAMIETTSKIAPLTQAAVVTDDELVGRIRAGDQDAFAMLVERHKRSVYNLAYRVLGNAADAEDAAQETFLRAYTRLHTYVPEERFGAWINAICSHWCIDTLRTRQRRVQTVMLGRVPESDRFLTTDNSPEKHVLTVDLYDQLQGWLNALPAHYRSILVLRYLQDLSYQEIADVTGEPISTVRMRLFRARQMLGQIIEEANRADYSAPVLAHFALA